MIWKGDHWEKKINAKEKCGLSIMGAMNGSEKHLSRVIQGELVLSESTEWLHGLWISLSQIFYCCQARNIENSLIL